MKAFLCRSSRTYDSFSLATLSELFELPRPHLLQLLNRQIIKNKLMAHLDLESQHLIMDVERVQNKEAQELQQLSL